MYLAYSIYFLWLMFYEYVFNKRNKVLLAFSCLLIAVLASIRYQIGTDYNSYFSMFQSLLKDPNTYPRIEFGWRYTTYFLSFLGFNEYGCFAFWGTLTMALVYYGLEKHASHPLIGCSFFFFAYTAGGLFNGMRQMLVCAIVIAGLGVIKRRNHWQAIVIFLVAISIHKIAIVLIPLYILLIFDPIIGKHKYWIIIVAMILGIGGYFVNLLLFSTDYIPSQRIAHSIQFNILIHPNSENEWDPEGIARRFVLVVCILYFSEKIRSKWQYGNIAVPLYFWGNVIAFLLMSSLAISHRTCMLVKVLDLLILPSLLLVSDRLIWKRSIMAIIVLWCIYTFYRTLFLGNQEFIYPFKTIFGDTLVYSMF